MTDQNRVDPEAEAFARKLGDWAEGLPPREQEYMRRILGLAAASADRETEGYVCSPYDLSPYCHVLGLSASHQGAMVDVGGYPTGVMVTAATFRCLSEGHTPAGIPLP